MKSTFLRFIVGAAIGAIAFPVYAQLPKEAICAVCRITEGAAKPEKATAASVFQGVTYYFCAQKCKEEFDADPIAYLPPVLPRPAPHFALANLAGEKIALKNFRGKAVLLDFWATWCKPCVKSMPALQKLHDKFAPKGFTVLGISTDEEKKKVKPFIEKHKIAYPILLDAEESPAWEIYKVKVIPMMFLIDAKGQIVKQWVGEADMKEVESAIAGLVATSDKK
jgi:peroxiredoxin